MMTTSPAERADISLRSRPARKTSPASLANSRPPEKVFRDKLTGATADGHSEGMIYGYARVSILHQNFASRKRNLFSGVGLMRMS
jgi:hypothetical protein